VVDFILCLIGPLSQRDGLFKDCRNKTARFPKYLTICYFKILTYVTCHSYLAISHFDFFYLWSVALCDAETWALRKIDGE